MKSDWIYETWNLSKNDDNAYTTDEFYQKHKVPIFYNLVITSTGIPEADKNEIIKLINDNGGKYTGSFKVSFDFYICASARFLSKFLPSSNLLSEPRHWHTYHSAESEKQWEIQSGCEMSKSMSDDWVGEGQCLKGIFIAIPQLSNLYGSTH